MKKFLDYKSITKQQWITLGCTVLFLLVFMWREHERRRPFEEASRAFEEMQENQQKLECDFLRQQNKWKEYDQQCQ